MNDLRFEELLGRLLDHELEQDEIQQLVKLASTSPARLAELRSQLQTAELLSLSEDELRDSGLFVAALQSKLEQSRQELDPFVDRVSAAIGKPAESRLTQRRTMILVGSPLLAIGLLALWFLVWSRAEHSADSMTIVELSGSVRFVGDGGEMIDDLQVGDAVNGGTVETLSPDAWAIFEFKDGSSFTVSGRSQLTVSDQVQKRVRLQFGQVSFEIVKQTPGKPVVISTPTANVEVRGTRFDVDASATRTKISVSEGIVSFTRLADGKSLEVSANQTVTATADITSDLRLIARKPPQTEWVGDLEQGIIVGKWTSQLELIGYKLKSAVAAGHLTKLEASERFKAAAELDSRLGTVWAEPWIQKHKEDTSNSSVQQIVVVGTGSESNVPILVSNESVLRIEGVLTHPTPLEVGIATRRLEGGFAGKFSTLTKVEDFVFDGDEFTIEIPVSKLTALGRPATDSSASKHVTEIWCSCFDSEVKFGITALEFTSQSSED